MTHEVTGYLDASDRGKLRLTGPQRAWFLHQILTKSFEDIAPGDARAAALLTPNGRMIGFLEVVATEDALLAHFEAELRPTLPDAIQRYVLATDVAIEDVTDSMGLILVVGSELEDRARQAGGVIQPTNAVGVGASHVWLERDRVGTFLDDLRAAGARSLAETDLDLPRVRAGVPRWGREMDVKTFPQEVGIDAFAVDYDKGCYVGQEAMAKIHFRGKPNRRLARLVGEDDLEAGAEVRIDGTVVGRVTTAAGSEALAIVKHDVDEGAAVFVGEVRASVGA